MARLDRTRFITLVALLLVAAPLAGCLDRARQPGAPVLAVDGSTIRATNVSADAAVILYDADTDTRLANVTADADGVAVFTGVAPGRYYVTQSLFGREGTRSNVVEIVPPPGDLTASGGVERVDVTGAEAGASLTLHDSADDVVSTGTADDQGEASFTGVEPGTGYYVTQTLGGLESDPSNAVDVQPPAPLATGGTNRVTVTDARPGAEVRLYDSGGNVVDSGTAGSLGGIEFADVPAGSGYTATQVVNGVESPPSPAATVTGLQAVGGVLQVTVNGVESGAEVTLYQAADPASPDPASDTEVNATTSTASSVVFGDVTPGRGYYATQTLEGEESQPSNRVSAQPPAPDAKGGFREVEVANFTEGATLHLYGPPPSAGADGPLVATEEDVTEQTFNFTGLDAGVGYTATQEVNEVESPKSDDVEVTGGEVTAPVVESIARGIRVSQVFEGASVTLYRNASGAAPDPSTDDVVRQVADVEGGSVDIDEDDDGNALELGTWYYATQTLGGTEGPNSTVTQILPQTPGASGGPRSIGLTKLISGATVQLVRGPTQDEVRTKTASGSSDNFANVEPATDYRVRQWVDEDFPSPFTATVRVQPRVVTVTPDAVNRAITVEDISTNGTSGAAVTLYIAADPGTPDPGTDTVVNSTSGVTDGTLNFTADDAGDPLERSEGYYATQTVNGSESVESLRVTLRPPAPTATGGVERVNVTGLDAEAHTVFLYNATDDVVAQQAVGADDEWILFEGVAVGPGYHATQNASDVESLASNVVDVIPEAPMAVGAVASTKATTEAGANIRLYDDGGALVRDAVDGGSDDLDGAEDGVVIFGDLAGGDYEVARALNGTESTRVSVTVSAPPTVTAEPNAVNVTGAQPDGTLALFEADGSAATDENGDPITATADGNGEHEFRFLAPGSYYVNHTDSRTAPYVNRTVAVTVDGLLAEIIDRDPPNVDSIRILDIPDTGSVSVMTVRLYDDATGEEVASKCDDNDDNAVTFHEGDGEGLDSGETYYATVIETATCNGLALDDESNPSNKVIPE